MGRNNRRRNKRNVDNTAGVEKPYRPRLGNVSGSRTPEDSGDGPESYSKPSSRITRKRGSGKLRARGQDDEVSPESSAQNNGDTRPPFTTEAQPGFPGGSLEQETNSSMHNLAINDSKRPRQQKVQQRTTPGDEKDEEASANENGSAPVVATNESPGTGDGSFDDDGGPLGHPPVSCTSAATTATPSAGQGVVVPTLPLGSNHEIGDRDEKQGRVQATPSEVDRKPYSLAWAGGRKGRPLMKSVEDVLSGWLCTQEVKGICVGDEVVAVRALTTSSWVPLGRLAERLGMPDAVACALGLRLRARQWEELLAKIAAARDFLDLRAESACSSALAAFGSQESAPRPTDPIPIDPFTALAREEAAGLDLAELEVRQALRAQASQVAPVSCTSPASFLFLQGLDPDATGAVATSDLASFALGLLGFPPEVRFQASACWSSDAPHGIDNGTPRCTAAARRSGARRSLTRGSTSSVGGAVPRSTVSAGSYSASSRNRARRCCGVIERLATTAASPGSISRNGKRSFRGCRNNHPGQAWAQLDTPGKGSEALVAPTTTNSSIFFGAKTSAVQREHEARGNDDSETVITHSTFCWFVEGKKFDSKASLEGFLRTLAETGRLLAAHGAAAVEEEGASQSEAPFSATTTARRRISSAEDGSSGTEWRKARWGARGLRRASAQFVHGALPSPRSSVDWSTMTVAHSRGRTPTMSAHIGIAKSSRSTGAAAGGGSSARSSGAAGYPSSRSGPPATPTGASSGSGVFLGTPRGGVRGSGFVTEALSSFDVSGSGTLSSAEFTTAANRVTGLPIRQEWGDVLAQRFAAGLHGVGGGSGGGSGGGGGGGGVRWLGGSEEGDKNSRLDVAALVDFLRPKSFSLSVMTPFGLVELLLEDSCLTLGGLREIMVKKMFWRQHNCQVRRSDRDNFTLSRYYGTIPLDTESPGQRRRLVLDVLRPGELIFVTDRAAHRSIRQREPRSVPKFQYMMGERKRYAGQDTPETSTCGGASNAGRRKSSSDTATAVAATNASKPPRRSSAPTSSSCSPQRRLVRTTTSTAAAVSSSTQAIAGESRLSSPSERQLKGATSSRRARQPGSARRSFLKDDVVLQAARGGGGELLSAGGGAEEQGREGFREGVSRPVSPPPKERRSTFDFSTMVFDWSVDQVERWIGETLELECCREVFRANKLDGLRLGGLSRDHLMKDIGIKNAFHARKVDLHLDRLLEDALGPTFNIQIPRGVATWRNREFLAWCWQKVGVRHRPTLALLHQAGIDGVVLLALEPGNWAHLVATSPHASCTAPLGSIRQATLELMAPLGNPLAPPGDTASPENNDADWPSPKLRGDNVRVTNDDVEGIAEKTPDDHTFAAQRGCSRTAAPL